MARKDYAVGINLTGVGVDDPDVNFYENYACKSERNYTQYCNAEVDKLIEAQSREADLEKRKQLVWQIEQKLDEDVARPIIYHDRAAHCWQPHVKGYIAEREQRLQQLAVRGRLARQVASRGKAIEPAVGAYLIRRLLLMMLTLFGMSVLIFVMLRMVPGNITDILFDSAGMVNPAEAEDREGARSRPADRRAILQWIGGLLRGDLGYAYVSEKPAIEEILPRIPVTAKLAGLALFFSVLLGVPLGVISAVRQNTALDYILRVVSLSGLSLPSFWLGLLILMGFVHYLGWIPIYNDRPASIWHELALLSIPAAAVGFRSSALIMRLTRSSMLEVLRQDYIRTARAKGASQMSGQLRSRAAQRRAAGGDHHRHRGGVPDRRADRHRDRVQHSGRGALPGGGDPLARLSDRAEPGHVHRVRGGDGEFHRRHGLRRARSAHQVRRS